MRKLVLDLAARSLNWALPAEIEGRITSEVPPDWKAYVVRSPTSSDGDGPGRPSEEVMREIADAEVYYGYGIPQVLFDAGRDLRWVHSAAAGVGSALHESMRRSKVTLTNSAGIHAVPIAEYVVAGVLHFLRGLDLAGEQQRDGVWDKSRFVSLDSPLREADTLRALIVGVGGIGGEAAKRLSGLGARCTGVRRRVSRGVPPGFARTIGLGDLDGALPEHDLVVLAAPLTPETRGLMSAARLDLLPPRAIVVNVSRGALLDETAVAVRLRDGRLRGAVLDVFMEEPLASSSPLWQLRNALITPHVSPVSPGRFWPRQLELFLDNWRRYVEGEPLRNVVDKAGGY